MIDGGNRRTGGTPALSLLAEACRHPVVGLVAFAIVSIAVVGSAVDYSNAEIAKANLQVALDNAAEQALRDLDRHTDDELTAHLASMLEKELVTEEPVESLSVHVDRKRRRLSCRATLRVETTVTGFIGPEYVDVSAMTETVVADAGALK